MLDDRRVSTPQGLALKILDVWRIKLPAHASEWTQDFILDTGKVFSVGEAKAFLAAITATEMAAPMPQPVKQVVSSVARVGNALLHAVGLNSANLDFYGHPFKHPLGELYFSQAPMHYGDYIAKLCVRPARLGLRHLADEEFAPQDADGLRTAVVAFFRQHAAEFEVRAQLCTDLGRMPVEDASEEWDEEESPYRPVARLTFPMQDAYSPERAAYVDEDLTFCPTHSLVVHRPFGSIMRARMRAYRVLANVRRRSNDLPIASLRVSPTCQPEIESRVPRRAP